MLNRRHVLIGLAATGALAATGMHPAIARAATAEGPLPPKPLRLLVCGRGDDDAFIAGARAAGGTHVEVVRLSAALDAFPSGVEGLLARSRGMYLGALVDEGQAILLEALAARAGARILATGTHARDESHAARHVIRTGQRAAGLAAALDAAGAGTLPARAPWTARLGESFATIAAGAQLARSPGAAPPFRATRTPAASPHSASLLLEV